MVETPQSDKLLIAASTAALLRLDIAMFESSLFLNGRSGDTRCDNRQLRAMERGRRRTLKKPSQYRNSSEQWSEWVLEISDVSYSSVGCAKDYCGRPT
jgi:hypothetical protein